MNKPRVAFFDFSSCEGCQLQIANLEEAVVDVLKLVDIVAFREVMKEHSDDYDIAFSAWTGDSWSGTEYVTCSPQDELDPRIYIDSFQKTYIVWWTAGSPDKVFLTYRTGGALDWKNYVQVVSDARRPSVVTHNDRIMIAFERGLGGGGQEVMVARVEDNGSTVVESVASTPRSDRLDVVIHSSGGRFWVDWKHSDSEFAYSILEDSGWSDPVTLSWTDKSWVGESVIRQAIKTEVLSP